MLRLVRAFDVVTKEAGKDFRLSKAIDFVGREYLIPEHLIVSRALKKSL